MDFFTWYAIEDERDHTCEFDVGAHKTVNHIDELDDKFQECIKSGGHVIHRNSWSKLRIGFTHVDGFGNSQTYMMRLGAIKCGECEDASRRDKLVAAIKKMEARMDASYYKRKLQDIEKHIQKQKDKRNGNGNDQR